MKKKRAKKLTARYKVDPYTEEPMVAPKDEVFGLSAMVLEGGRMPQISAVSDGEGRSAGPRRKRRRR